MLAVKQYNVWFITGSQHLYGPETLEQVAQHAKEIAAALDASAHVPVNVIYKPVVTTSTEIVDVFRAANADPACVGVVTWMHTFSPAKNWIAGLSVLDKPMAHFHTQYNRDIPWADIDMDFMNLNQTAHGGREFGFMMSRMRMHRKVIVGFWQDEDVQVELGQWARVARAWQASRTMKIARIGDNMRYVAVTEGDKVEAQIKFGYEVNGYGVGDLVAYVNQVTDTQVDTLVETYGDEYTMATDLLPGGERHNYVREAARIELGLRTFLEAGDFSAFTTTFEDLHGLEQLPGLAVQRLMADGYGFGAEGDWKTAALVRTLKVMSEGMSGGTSFMEDYTYHFHPDGMKVLGAHMLEVCPSIADAKPSLEVHPLGIGGKADPARLVFETGEGLGLNASIMDMGDRFRLVVNVVDVVKPDAPMPRLPVTRVLWSPQPDLKTAAAAWIYAGGAHHSAFSQAVSVEMLDEFASIAGIEMLLIDNDTTLRQLKNEIRWNEASF